MNNKFLPEHAERVAELQAMSWDELVSECDRILARYLTTPGVGIGDPEPNPARIPTNARVSDFIEGRYRTVGQISTGG